MRSTDFCFPLSLYEYPRLASYRHLFETCVSPLACGLAPETRRPGDLAFHDAESASVSSSRLAPGVFFRALLSSCTSDTSVASGAGRQLSLNAFLPVAEAASFASP